jgi:hypothetical protein
MTSAAAAEIKSQAQKRRKAKAHPDRKAPHLKAAARRSLHPPVGSESKRYPVAHRDRIHTVSAQPAERSRASERAAGVTIRIAPDVRAPKKALGDVAGTTRRQRQGETSIRPGHQVRALPGQQPRWRRLYRGEKGRSYGRPQALATIPQPSRCILRSCGLGLPKRQCERFAGASRSLRPGLTLWTGTTT